MTASIVPCELTSDELLLARNTFDSVVDDYLRAEHQLRQVLSKMGLFAPDDQLNVLMEHFENKISFTSFHQFLMFLKGVHKQPEPEDADTLRAFIALGGNSDRSGNVNADHLRFACKRFDLTIDIDKLIREVDTSRNGTIDYEEFQELWRMGKGQGLPLVITDESKSMGKSFWMDAVRQAHTATAEIEEELSPSSHQQQQDAHSLLNGSTTDHGGSASDLTAQHNINNNASSADHQQGSGGAASMTLPEAVGRVHLGVVIGGAATEQQVEEMPKIDQLRNFLEVGDCSGAPPASNNNTVEFGRRRQSNQPHAHFSASNVLGSHNDLRHLAQSARMMSGSTIGGAGGAGRRASQSVMMMQQSGMMGGNNNEMMQSSVNNNNLDDNRGNNTGNGNYLPASSTHFMLRSNNNPNGMNRYEPPLPASDLLPDPNASPAEVLKKAKELMEERKEHRKKYDLKQESADLDEKVAQMAKQRPPVIGGITLPGKRSNDIELPDPYTIGSSGAGLHHPASGRRNQMISPTRSTADMGSTGGGITTSARYSSGSTMGSARGSARRGWK